MAEWRIAGPAEAQLARILADSAEGWGPAGRDRYAALLLAAMQDVADDPARPGSTLIDDRLRIYHSRHSRRHVVKSAGRVRRPRQVLVYEVAADGIVNILGLFYDGIPTELMARRTIEPLR